MHLHDHGPEALERTRPRSPRREDEGLGALQAALSGVPEAVTPQGVLGLQRTAGNATVAQLLAGDEPDDGADYGVSDVVGGGGSALDDNTRATMEDRLGADFSDVRVHTDGAASESAKQLGAHAYTVGRDIAFQSGQYSPGTASGQRMLAHELTHVVQQRSGPVSGEPVGGGVAVSHPSDRFEQEAERTADAVMRSVDGNAVQRCGSGHAPEPGVQREAAEPEEELQMSAVQREAVEEEEELQMSAVQREAVEEEEELQMSAVQRDAEEEGPAAEDEALA